MILVTGGTGFVGRHAVERLRQRVPVRVLARRGTHPASGVQVARGDLTRPETLPEALEGVEVVVHAAAITGDRKEPFPGAYDRVNRVGAENLASAAAAAGVKRMVALSGLGTHPAPPGSYMATRWGAEEAIRSCGVPFVILRPSVLFGAGSPFVNALASLVRRAPAVPVIGSGRRLFQPLWVEDLARCIDEACAADGLVGEAHELGGPAHLTFRSLIEVIAEALGKRRLVVPVPMVAARLQARLMTAVMAQPPLTPAAIELFEFDNITDLDAVPRAFGFTPRDFREHLRTAGVAG